MTQFKHATDSLSKPYLILKILRLKNFKNICWSKTLIKQTSSNNFSTFTSVRRTHFLFFLILTRGLACWILERGKKRDRERGKYQCERATFISCLSCSPLLLINLQPRYVPWPGIKLVTFQFNGRCSNQMSHAGQGNTYSHLHKAWWKNIITCKAGLLKCL